MAVRTISTTPIIEGTLNTAGAVLGAGDTLNVTPIGLIFVFGTGGNGVVSVSGATNFTIDGTIISVWNAGILAVGGSDTFNISATGTLYGYVAGAAIGDADNTVTNEGNIGGFQNGLNFSGANEKLVNSGAIIGATNDGIFSSGNTVNINNSGFIGGANSGFGLHLNGTTNTIINSGTITGGGGIDTNGGTGVDALLNFGSVIGTNVAGFGYFGSNAVDNIINNGLIQGPSFAVNLAGGNDTYDGKNGKAVGSINGGDGNDTIYGGAAGDIINGDDGDDTIIGGPGGDVLRGGLGKDTFIYNFGDGGDLIKGLNEGGVKDVFDLRGFFDKIGFTGADPRAANVMQVLQNGLDTDVYLNGGFAFRIEGVVAAAIDNSYFLIQ